MHLDNLIEELEAIRRRQGPDVTVKIRWHKGNQMWPSLIPECFEGEIVEVEAGTYGGCVIFLVMD